MAFLACPAWREGSVGGGGVYYCTVPCISKQPRMWKIERGACGREDTFTKYWRGGSVENQEFYEIDNPYFFLGAFLAGPIAASRRLASLASISVRLALSWASFSSFSACIGCQRLLLWMGPARVAKDIPACGPRRRPASRESASGEPSPPWPRPSCRPRAACDTAPWPRPPRGPRARAGSAHPRSASRRLRQPARQQRRAWSAGGPCASGSGCWAWPPPPPRTTSRSAAGRRPRRASWTARWRPPCAPSSPACAPRGSARPPTGLVSTGRRRPTPPQRTPPRSPPRFPRRSPPSFCQSRCRRHRGVGGHARSACHLGPLSVCVATVFVLKKLC